MIRHSEDSSLVDFSTTTAIIKGTTGTTKH